ncbi:hypothetical protein [Nonomuraea rubra]|uniref:hypothetical protein n=1 Tax=Nonomuraea rubra TaxID=46180 RepID=UPI0031EFA503
MPDHGARRTDDRDRVRGRAVRLAPHTSGAFASPLPGGHFYLDAAERPVLDTLWRCLAPRHALTRYSS